MISLNGPTSYKNSFENIINGVSGMIAKTHPKSKFKFAHVNSPYIKNLEEYEGIVVLQIMQSHCDKVIVEYVSLSDFIEE